MGRKSNYENGMLYQLQEIMGRLDSVESELRTEKKEHKEDVERLNAKIDSLTPAIFQPVLQQVNHLKAELLLFFEKESYQGSSIIASIYPLSQSRIRSFFAASTAGEVKYWFVMTTPTMRS